MIRQILIAGDSTVTNRKVSDNYESGVCYTGWGEMISLYLGINYRVKNFALSGRTTDTFRSEGHYNNLISELNEGDYVLFQFGHNDQKREELQHNGRYRENLINFVSEIREKKANPILVTPLARNSFNCDTYEYNDLLIDYANIVKEVSRETDTPLIDLHNFSKQWIINEGREEVKAYFYPGDFTHTNDYGAFKFAGYVCECLDKIIEPELNHIGWLATCPSKIPTFLYEQQQLNLTRLEALRLFREFCAYFAKNEIVKTSRNTEIICAEQNGYNIFKKDLAEFVTEAEFVTLLYKATSGRESLPQGVFDEIYENNDTINRKKAVVYLDIFEEKMNYSRNKIQQEIKGS